MAELPWHALSRQSVSNALLVVNPLSIHSHAQTMVRGRASAVYEAHRCSAAADTQCGPEREESVLRLQSRPYPGPPELRQRRLGAGSWAAVKPQPGS